jgi:hypothetical protein
MTSSSFNIYKINLEQMKGLVKALRLTVANTLLRLSFTKLRTNQSYIIPTCVLQNKFSNFTFLSAAEKETFEMLAVKLLFVNGYFFLLPTP